MEIREGANAHYKLRDQVKMWPTPKKEPSGPDYARQTREGSGGDDLATAVARMVPSPNASHVDTASVEGAKYCGKYRPKGIYTGGGMLNPKWFIRYLRQLRNGKEK